MNSCVNGINTHPKSVWAGGKALHHAYLITPSGNCLCLRLSPRRPAAVFVHLLLHLLPTRLCPNGSGQLSACGKAAPSGHTEALAKAGILTSCPLQHPLLFRGIATCIPHLTALRSKQHVSPVPVLKMKKLSQQQCPYWNCTTTDNEIWGTS
jgi:hypothetical protein